MQFKVALSTKNAFWRSHVYSREFCWYSMTVPVVYNVPCCFSCVLNTTTMWYVAQLIDWRAVHRPQCSLYITAAVFNKLLCITNLLLVLLWFITRSFLTTIGRYCFRARQMWVCQWIRGSAPKSFSGGNFAAYDPIYFISSTDQIFQIRGRTGQYSQSTSQSVWCATTKRRVMT